MTQISGSAELHFVVFQTGPIWAAQCLEHDLGAQAATLDDVLYELQRVIFGELLIAKELGAEPFEGREPAPREYWDKWNASKLTVDFPQEPFAPSMTYRPATEVRLVA